MEKVLEEIRQLIKARYPYLYLVSHEEQRVLRGLRWLCGNRDERLSVWTSTLGLVSAGTVAENTGDPLEALKKVRHYEPKQIFVFKDFHPFLREIRVLRALRDLEADLEETQKTVIFLSPSVSIPAELEKDIVVLDVPLPSAAEIAHVLGTLMQANEIEIPQERFEKIVKASLGLTEKEIRKVYARILISGNAFAESDLELVIQEKRKIIRKSQYLEFVDNEERVEDLGGLGQLKSWLIDRGQAFTERARAFGLPQPKGVFLLGVQGCGKSLTAKVVARMWRLPLLRIDLASMFSAGTAGGSDQNLRDTIRIAESMAPVILWIDEIEKAFGAVGGDGQEKGAAYRMFGQLLTWLQEKTHPVFVIATANDVTNLPPELLRKGRFDEIFFIDLPNIHDRAEILAIHLRRRKREPADFDLYAVAEITEKFSGAELEQLVISALFHAFSRNRELQTDDLLRQARESVPLAVTMDERVKALKEWATHRTRPAAFDTRRIDFFEEWEELG